MKLQEAVLLDFNGWMVEKYPQLINAWNDLPDFIQNESFLEYARVKHGIHGEACNDVGRYVGFVDWNNGFQFHTETVCEEAITRDLAIRKVVKKVDRMIFDLINKSN